MRDLTLDTPSGDGMRDLMHRLRRSGSASGALVMLAGLCVLFGLLAPNFLATSNLVNVALQSTILLLIALPMTLIIMTEGLDLSVGAVLTLANVVLATIAVKTGGVGLSLLSALAIGAVFGLLNGTLVARLGIPPFVATLGTLGVAQGMALVVTDGQSVVGIPESVQMLYSGALLGVPLPICIAVIAYLAFHVVLYHTRFGACVFALGGNREALSLAGVRMRWYLVAVYLISGLMAGLAALLLTARISAGHPTAALGIEFDAIAAVAVGGTSFERGKGWLLGTLIGVLAVGVLRNGLNLMGVSSAVQVAAIGFLVILALTIDALRERNV
ncbi:MAG: ABC transporter permease [Proteobacteria bacterium]|nr:ABC transporter permease [Pseudomonadota bacterium]